MTKWGLLCCCFLTASAFASTKQVPKTELRVNKAYSHLQITSGTLSVITRQDIVQSGAQNLSQLLQNVAGLHLFSSDNASTPSISLRGFGGNAASNSLVLLNGFPLRNPDMASTYLNLIPLSSIAAIQIMPESGGALYGDGAVGGVINIITRQPKQFTGQVSLGKGSYDGKSHGAYLGGAYRQWRYFLQGGKQSTDGYRHHSKSKKSNVLAKIGYETQKNSANIEYQIFNQAQLYPGSTAKPSNSEYFNTQNHLYQVHFKHVFNQRWRVNGQLTQRKTDGRGLIGHSLFTKSRDVIAFMPKFTGLLPYDNIMTINGIDLERDVYRFLASGYTTNDSRSVRSVYSHWLIPLTSHYSITLGARWAGNYNSLNGGYHIGRAFVTEQSVIYKPQADWRFYLRRAGSYRFPKADETGNNNQQLKTQTGASYETGFTWQQQKMQVQAEAYLIDLKHEIAYATTTPDQTTQANRNLDPTRRLGYLVNVRYPLTDKFSVMADYHYALARYRSGPFKHKAIPMVSKDTGRLAGKMQWSKHWSTYVAALFTGPYYVAGDDANRFHKGGYTVYNSNILWRWHRVSIGLRINNLFNKQYSTYTVYSPYYTQLGYYPAPGRNYWMTLHYDFGA